MLLKQRNQNSHWPLDCKTAWFRCQNRSLSGKLPKIGLIIFGSEKIYLYICGPKEIGIHMIKPEEFVRFLVFLFCYTPKRSPPSEGRIGTDSRAEKTTFEDRAALNLTESAKNK